MSSSWKSVSSKERKPPTVRARLSICTAQLRPLISSRARKIGTPPDGRNLSADKIAKTGMPCKTWMPFAPTILRHVRKPAGRACIKRDTPRIPKPSSVMLISPSSLMSQRPRSGITYPSVKMHGTREKTVIYPGRKASAHIEVGSVARGCNIGSWIGSTADPVRTQTHGNPHHGRDALALILCARVLAHLNRLTPHAVLRGDRRRL